MSLIENLLDDAWEPNLRRTFVFVLHVLTTDPFTDVGSSADDLRAWIRAGGVERVREALKRELDVCRVPAPHSEAVLAGLERLVAEHEKPLGELVAKGIIPGAGRPGKSVRVAGT